MERVVMVKFSPVWYAQAKIAPGDEMKKLIFICAVIVLSGCESQEEKALKKLVEHEKLIKKQISALNAIIDFNDEKCQTGVQQVLLLQQKGEGEQAKRIAEETKKFCDSSLSAAEETQALALKGLELNGKIHFMEKSIAESKK